jgi:U4/U6.U5 tri-snRNP-associated protein 2
VDFLGWLLNNLHRHMGGTKKKNSSKICGAWLRPRDLIRRITGIIFSTFQGQLRQDMQNILVRPETGSDAKPQFDIERGEFGRFFSIHIKLIVP